MSRTRKTLDRRIGSAKPASLQLIATHFRNPDAIIAALLSAGNAVIAQMAAGATCPEEPNMKIPSSLGPRAAREALVWDRIARLAQDGVAD